MRIRGSAPIAVRITLWVIAALLVVLAGTGAWLAFRYNPADVHPSVLSARRIHRVAAQLMVAASAALVLCALVGFVGKRSALIVVSIGVAAFAFVASFTGYLLPWDQLSISSVTVGSNIHGYERIVRGTDVRFVLVGSSAVGSETIARWFLVHTIAVPALLVACVIAFETVARKRENRGAGQDGTVTD